MTQAQRLIAAIRRRPMTYMELQDLHVSTSPHKRISEAGHKFLRPGEQIVRKTGKDGLVRFCIKKAAS